MKILITGSEGFVGSHLVPRLRADGHEVLATGRCGPIDETLIVPDEARARELLREFQPEVVFHLAALSHVAQAEAAPEDTFRVNVEGTASLLRGVAAEVPSCRFIFVSSSTVYGIVAPEQQPLRESLGVRPVNSYSWSKVGAESYVQAFGRLLAHEPVILRPFNHVGPAQSSDFALPGFARQIAEIELGQRDPVIHVGNLQVRRDILDVRDVVEAYARVVATPTLGGTFNVSAQQGYLLADLLDRMVAESTADVRVEVDPARLRPNDLEVLIGDSTLLREALGWEPQIDMSRTLSDLVDDWRQRTAAEEPESVE